MDGHPRGGLGHLRTEPRLQAGSPSLNSLVLLTAARDDGGVAAGEDHAQTAEGEFGGLGPGVGERGRSDDLAGIDVGLGLQAEDLDDEHQGVIG